MTAGLYMLAIYLSIGALVLSLMKDATKPVAEQEAAAQQRRAAAGTTKA